MISLHISLTYDRKKGKSPTLSCSGWSHSRTSLDACPVGVRGDRTRLTFFALGRTDLLSTLSNWVEVRLDSHATHGLLPPIIPLSLRPHFYTCTTLLARSLEPQKKGRNSAHLSKTLERFETSSL